jgi:methionyl-tRNA synthetase
MILPGKIFRREIIMNYAIYGNFINRVVVLTNKYYNGIVPQPNEFSEVDEATLTELKAYPAVISSSLERYRFREALSELMNGSFRK